MTNDEGREPEGAPERSPKVGAGAPSGVDGNGPKRFSVQRKLAIVARHDRAHVGSIYASSLVIVVRGKATRIPVHRKARPLLRWRPERWHDKGGLMRGRISRPTIAVVALLAALCLAPRDQAASAPEIEATVSATLEDFFREVWSGRDLANQAVAILVFPTIVKAGFGIGGEYGEGALHIRGRTAGYYNIVSASIGFQFGAQARSVIIMFMTEAALANFQRTDGWKVGIDGSIAIITVGAGGQIDTNSIRSPVIGFIFDQKGLMYNLTLEGSKISRIQR